MTDGKQIEQERWELPKKFLTPEVLAAADEEQRRLAAVANLPFGSPSPQELERARAAQRAEHLRQTLEGVLGANVFDGPDSKRTESIVALKHQLAEAYAIMGRYDLAAEIEPDPAYAREYSTILQAVFRDDDEWCDCGDNRGSGDQATISVPSQFVKAEVFSMKANKSMFLIACQKCGLLNVTEMPDVLRQQRAHRARAQQLVGNLSPQEAEAALRKANHTTARLLKR